MDNPTAKIKKLADFYGVPVKGLKAAELLFAVHSYYAIFMKLMAAEIVAFFHRLPTPLQKMLKAPTMPRSAGRWRIWRPGSIFRHLNITNFLEGDLFAGTWPSGPGRSRNWCATWRRGSTTTIPARSPKTPAGSRDLVKRLYQQLFPPSVRRDLGEYLHARLASRACLVELDYIGDPDKRLLDPACGSGTFLVMAINRIRRWYDENREKCQFGGMTCAARFLAT